MMNKSNALAGFLAIFALAGCTPAQDSANNGAAAAGETDLHGAAIGGPFTLTDQDGKPRSWTDFKGQYRLVYFGYTRCPDVCPTTLADMAAAMKALGKDADRVQVLFVTLDPARDTRDVLSMYVPAFDPRFLGLYGDEDATRMVAKEFKIFYEKVEGGAPGAYTVNHSAQSYVFDTQGRLRLFERHDRLGEDLPHDLKAILKEAG